MAEQTKKGPIRDLDGSLRWDYWVNLELWEDDEYVITLGGTPVGQTLSAKEGLRIRDWLVTAIDEIVSETAIKSELDCLRKIKVEAEKVCGENDLQQLFWLRAALKGGA